MTQSNQTESQETEVPGGASPDADYDDKVASAANSLIAAIQGDNAKWELARLTYENTQSGGGQPTGGKVGMKQWCLDVEAEAKSIEAIKSVRTPGLHFSLMQGRRFKRIYVEFLETVSRGKQLDSGKFPDWDESYQAVREDRTKSITTDTPDGEAPDNISFLKVEETTVPIPDGSTTESDTALSPEDTAKLLANFKVNEKGSTPVPAPKAKASSWATQANKKQQQKADDEKSGPAKVVQEADKIREAKQLAAAEAALDKALAEASSSSEETDVPEELPVVEQWAIFFSTFESLYTQLEASALDEGLIKYLTEKEDLISKFSPFERMLLDIITVTPDESVSHETEDS